MAKEPLTKREKAIAINESRLQALAARRTQLRAELDRLKNRG